MDAKQNKIIEFVKSTGPITTTNLAKFLGTDSLMASAMLSELVSAKQIFVSHLKLGSGPLYYLKGQEYKLQEFSNKLNEKEQRVFAQLKEKKLLRESELNPLFRVAIRQIRDFARPLEVNHKGVKEIFWKWYLLDNKDAERIIISKLKKEIPKTEPKKEISKPERKEEKKLEVKKTELKKEAPKLETKEARKPIREEQKKIIEKPIKETKKLIVDNFHEDVLKYFKKNSISVQSQNIIRKTEIEFLVEIPSNVGSLNYYCKAKNKKILNDADLAAAFVRGQMKKLPILLITTGNLTKKAKEMLTSEFNGMSVKHI